MKSIILKALAVSTLAVFAAYAMIIFGIPMFGEQINPSAWVLGVVGPYLIGMPVGLFCFWQADRLKTAHEQLVAAHEELRLKSRIDAMTGMLNRETFMTVIGKRLARRESGVLLIADADNFKQINDNFGHLNGDTALRLMSGAILAGVREQDIVGRIGGEEFAIFLSGASPEQATEISERVRRRVEAIVFRPASGPVVALTLSAGAAQFSADLSLSEILRNADRCLYEAKKTGRNRVIFHQEFKEAA